MMMYKSVGLYQGDKLLGDVDVLYPLNNNGNGVVLEEEGIRITHFSPPSERCSPLSVLHTINSNGVCLKLQSTNKPLVHQLHSECLRDNKVYYYYISSSP